MNPVVLAWMAEAGIITIRDLVGSRRLPLPSELLATFVAFGTLSVVSESATFRGAANVTAWGLVLATLYVAYSPPSEGGLGYDLLKPVADFFGGTGPTAQPAGAPVVQGAAPSARPVTNQGGGLLNAQKGL